MLDSAVGIHILKYDVDIYDILSLSVSKYKFVEQGKVLPTNIGNKMGILILFIVKSMGTKYT